jgi:hypothetical protein
LKYFPNSQLSFIDYGFIGFGSGAMTAVLTNPLDCVNTRIKSGELRQSGIIQAHYEIIQRDGWKALFRGIIPRIFVISCGSSVFWTLQNALLTAIDG